jgi:hypothetical protein
MKTLLFLITFTFFSFYVNAQLIKEMRYAGKHEIVYNDVVLKTPSQIRPLIKEKDNAVLTKVFRKYRRKRQMSQLLGVFGLLFGPATVVNEISDPNPNYGMAGFIAVAAGSAYVAQKPAHRALRKLVDEYNDVVLIERLDLEREFAQRSNVK